MTIRNGHTDRLLDDHHNPGEIARRLAAIDDAPVATLNSWVRRVREREEDDTVPWFDPLGGGEQARLLFLAQDPSEVAAKGSGFISPDNNDRSAANTTLACRMAEIASRDRVHWNILPWWAANPSKPPAPLDKHLDRAAPYFDELLTDLLPRLEVVVLLGKPAQKGWAQSQANRRGGSMLKVLSCPHPSPLAWNKIDKATGRKNGELTIETLCEASKLLS